MITRAVNAPGDRTNDKTLVTAFRDSLDVAKRSGAVVLITRSATDYEALRWVDGAWECQSIARPNGGAAILGYGA